MGGSVKLPPRPKRPRLDLSQNQEYASPGTRRYITALEGYATFLERALAPAVATSGSEAVPDSSVSSTAPEDA